MVGPRSIAGQSLTGGRARLDRLHRPGLTVFCGDAQCGRRAGRPCARTKIAGLTGSRQHLGRLLIHHWPEYHGRARPPSSAPDAARVRVPPRVPQRCGADRGPAGVRSAVSHRHDGEPDYHSDTAPNPGRQARSALGFAAPAWALSAGTGGLGHARSALARAAC